MKNSEMEYETVNVVMGPCNGANDPHPQPIIAACIMLGTPLPDNAVCGMQPSEYIGKEALSGSLDDILEFFGGTLPNVEMEYLKKAFYLFGRKYKTQKNLDFNNTDLTVYFCDWLFFARERGFTHNCYFDYELYNKEADIRDTFLNEGYRIRVHNACGMKGYRKLFSNKALFNKKYAKFVQRDWVDASTCTFEEFRAFAEKHERFFGKPVKGTGGAGARVVKRDEFPTLEALFEMCVADDLICEELIQQHADVARINASTLNTVRITTLLCADGIPRIVLTVARFGREGRAVDNFHGGGVGAIVDIETGKIITEAINMDHERKAYHPDSKESILGFQYPEWEKVKAAVCEAALMVPQVRNIGWDVCVTKDGEVEFVEGNGRPNYDVLQSPDQMGRRFRYVPYLAEIEEMKGIKYEELAPLVINFADKRACQRKRSEFNKRKGL